jgi:putative ABC transport system permease protein
MSTPPAPPWAALWLLKQALSPDDYETITGDLEETLVADIGPRLGARRARRWYWRQTVNILISVITDRPGLSRDEPSGKGTSTVAAIWQDVRYATRALRKQPGFTVVAMMTLVLGIGANVAIFSVLHALLFKPLPYGDAARLMLVHLLVPDRERGAGFYREGVWSYPKYVAFRDRQQAFDQMALFGSREWSLTGTSDPERLRGELVAASFFSVLGAHPQIGRGFLPEEDLQPSTSRVAVIGHGLWRRRFGGNPAVLGQAIGINKIPHTIVGVMRPGFRGLSGQADIWIPLMTEASGYFTNPWSHSYFLIARRKAEQSIDSAVAQVRAFATPMNELFPPSTGPEWGVTATPLEDERTDPLVRRALFLLLGAVGVVLLIGCANLASLMVARTLARQREIAVRLALGASRLRIVRQYMTEALLVSLAGATGGLVVGWGLLRAARGLLPDLNTALRFDGILGLSRAGLTRSGVDLIGLDFTTVVVAAAVAGAAALLFGLAPAWRAARHDLSSSMKAGGAGSLAQGSRGFGLRNVLVSAEIALALVLVVASGLMVRTVDHLGQIALGFDPRHVISLRVALPSAQYQPEQASRFFEQLIERMRSRGEIADAAAGSCAPISGRCSSTTAEFPGRPPLPRGTEPLVDVFWASSRYFDTLGIALVRGRSFTDHDRMGQPKVVVINETAARSLWKNEDPIGQRISVGQGGFHDGAEVIGIVRDVRYASVETAPTADVYIPILQSPQRSALLFVRGRVPAASLVPLIAREVRSLDPDLPLIGVKTMEERAADATWRTRALAWLLSLFGALALLLAAIGVFGVISQAVEQRTREIGLRIALGAAPRDITRMVVSRAAALSIAGIAIGFGLAIATSTMLSAFLFEVEPHDPATFWTVAAMVFVVALVASYLPARRAAHIDPLATMRAE